MFIGDISLDHDQDVEGVLEYPTVSGMTEENVFRLCTDVLVNSSVAKKCGRFFDRDIMHAIDMCVVGKKWRFTNRKKSSMYEKWASFEVLSRIKLL